MPGSTFTTALKTAATYIDVAANAHGEEKAHLVLQALKRAHQASPHLVEVGPGGGSAVAYLAAQLSAAQPPVDDARLTLVEVPGVTSASLDQAVDAFNRVGTCRLLTGFAQDIGTLLPEPADVISASALLHEVYSYGGGYAGLHSMIRTLPTVLKPGGMFAYRDVYAVKSRSLHDRTQQTYTARSWLRFLRMFLPQYLDEGMHPYHSASDLVVLRQDSRIVRPEELTEGTSVVASAPVGIFREVQRHYITLRDHIWRSGVLGVSPYLEGPLSGDWIDARSGHKRVHYVPTDTDWLPASQKAMLLALSEPYMDHHTVDGDIFDECTDIALNAFLDRAEKGDGECAEVWRSWVTREGRETYAYMTLDSLLAAVAVHSTEAAQEQRTVLMPVRLADVMRRDRAYYNRYLRRALPNPLKDAKQMVLFANVPVTDTDSLGDGMHCLQQWCSKGSLARVYAAINQGG
ncbi:class I SAM-dependent methyltransferase [Streptomyces sp. STCH 565 A]|uniref:class I SAM-dependent methyltransferase n=1 Tax=Streptomyces sp. STCH 565 A TaxID=2950532 RepID=UPI00207595D2|nr:class I SAM-dependent methyltransferase [Streptomyces sp. STCH 565 A]MCM8550083.1 class I SAM-dependent methyltransferase [Streptomyces sp. STCH 565 A]